MTPTRLLLALSALAVTAGPTFATTVVNQDSKEHTLTVDHGAKQDDHKIAAGDSLTVDCPEKCGMRVESSGYGRQPGNDGKLVIGKDGILRFASEQDDQGGSKGKM